jgi:hypothetical protein
MKTLKLKVQQIQKTKNESPEQESNQRQPDV